MPSSSASEAHQHRPCDIGDRADQTAALDQLVGLEREGREGREAAEQSRDHDRREPLRRRVTAQHQHHGDEADGGEPSRLTANVPQGKRGPTSRVTSDTKP